MCGRLLPRRACNSFGFTVKMSSRYRRLLIYDVKRTTKIDGMGPFYCAENCMKKIWANLITFHYNIGYMRRDHTFMYFQIKSDLREEIWEFGHFYYKNKFRVRNFYKKMLVMTNYYKQVKIINLYVPNNNDLLPEIPIPSFFQTQQKGRE